MSKFLITPFLFFFIISPWAEVITVTAERIERGLEQTTSTVTVITEKQIEQSQKSNLNDLLEEQAGLFLNSNGEFGKTSSLFLRGGDSSFNLVIIDGVEYSDKSSVGGAPLYEYLTLNNIKQIEILKGSQSVLYGSDAISGVIKITTKDAGTKGGNLSVSYGSYDNKSVSANTQGKGDHFDYSLGLLMKEAEGISSYNEKRVSMAEKDGYSNLTGQIKLKKNLYHDSSIQFNFLGIKAKSEYDNSSSDRTENVAKDDQYLFSSIYNKSISEFINPTIRFTQNKSDRLNTLYSSFSNSTSVNQLIAKTNKYELENMSLFEGFNLVKGFEFEDVKASISSLENQKTHKSYAAYLNFQKSWHRLELQAGARATEERDYDTQLVWKTGARLNLMDRLSVKGNASTGFKSPSLYQLHSSSGDENLRPTKSKSYDLGVDFDLFSHKIDLTYFHDIYTNFIDYDSTLSKYANTFKSQSSGVELAFGGKLQSLSYGFNATWLRAINKSRGKVGQYLARRPREKYSFYLDHSFEKTALGLDGRYVGQREDSDFNDIVLSSYFTMDVRGTYNLTSNSKLLLLIGNILNKDYEQVHGFGSLGRHWQLSWSTRL